MMTRVQVRDTAGNVFAYHDCESTNDAIAYASPMIVEGFRVEVIPIVPGRPTIPRRSSSMRSRWA